MTDRNRTTRENVSSEHIVQFFDTDESRARNVASFLAKGFEAGEPLLIVARPANATAIFQHLQILGVPVAAAVESGMLVTRDADETLRRLTYQGMPDAALFESTVAQDAVALGSLGRIRAYGEMVDILAQRGDVNAAVKLESLWNSLGERVPLFLLCGYSAAHFVSTSTHRALLDICRAHSSIHRDVRDPLGDWLLNSAHNGAASSTSLRH